MDVDENGVSTVRETPKNDCIYPIIWPVWIFHRGLIEQIRLSDLGLHCFPRHICPKTYGTLRQSDVVPLSHAMRLWYISSSVDSYFKRACVAVQWGLDVRLLVGLFVYFHTSCVRTAKALVKLRVCAGSTEPSLVAYVISTIISWAGSFNLIAYYASHVFIIMAYWWFLLES